MDFAIPPELAALRESFAAFLEREIRPLEEDFAPLFWEGAPDDDRVHEMSDHVRRLAAAHGFWAPYLPEVAGGQGLSVLGTTLLVEDAARSGMRLAMSAIAPPNPSGPSTLLLKLPKSMWGEYLLPLARAEKTMAFALTEPEAGSDAQAIRTTAVRDGDDWIINGHKHYISNADRASFAIVFALTDPQKKAAGGITAFLIPRQAYEVGKIQHNISDWHPMEMILRDVRVPHANIIGTEGLGFYEAMSFLNAGRAYIGAQSLGLAQWCLDQAVQHTRTRTAFGRPLSKNQGVSFPLAQSKVDIEAMRWLIYHLAWRVDHGNEAADSAALMGDASIVKYSATEWAYTVADRALQTFGGMGLMKDGPIEHVLRHLRMLRVVEGASEIQLLVIARTLGL
jgi:hypothetical protein